MGNIILHDVRNVFPRVEILPSAEDVVKDIHSDQYVVKTEEVYALNLISSQSAIRDLENSLKSNDITIIGISWASLGGIHTFNGNYSYAFSAFNKALDLKVSNNVKAYIYTEMSNLMRKLGYILEATNLLDTALKICSIDNLKWRIKTYLGICYNLNDQNLGLSILVESADYYTRNKDYIRLVTVERYIAASYRQLNEFEKAQEFLDKAVTIALENNLKSHYYSCLNDIGWLHVAKGDFKWAIQIYLDLLTYNLSPYSKSLALQNLGYIAFENSDYKEAISYHSQSLRITREQEMRDLLFEDYFKLSKSYDYIGETGLADHFYREGYRELQKEINLGLRLMGYRKSLLDNYVLFLQDHQQDPNVNMNDKIFDFTKDKQFKEIRKFFQRSLLTKHLERLPDTNSLCTQLGFDQRTYFNYQKKLNIKRGDLALDTNNPYFDQYLESLAQYPWREANNRFESELYSHLLSRYHFNKKKLATALGVSYAQVVQKTSKVRIES